MPSFITFEDDKTEKRFKNIWNRQNLIWVTGLLAESFMMGPIGFLTPNTGVASGWIEGTMSRGPEGSGGLQPNVQKKNLKKS